MIVSFGLKKLKASSTDLNLNKNASKELILKKTNIIYNNVIKDLFFMLFLANFFISKKMNIRIKGRNNCLLK